MSDSIFELVAFFVTPKWCMRTIQSNVSQWRNKNGNQCFNHAFQIWWLFVSLLFRVSIKEKLARIFLSLKAQSQKCAVSAIFTHPNDILVSIFPNMQLVIRPHITQLQINFLLLIDSLLLNQSTSSSRISRVLSCLWPHRLSFHSRTPVVWLPGISVLFILGSVWLSE